VNNHKALKAAFSNPKSFGATLLAAYVSAYGVEGLEWDVEAIRLNIQSDFGVELSDELLARLSMAIAIATSNIFFVSLPDFIDICNVLSGDILDPTVFDPADAEEIAWAITEALIIDPPDDDNTDPFVPEIIGYIQEVLKAEGILNPPDILRLGISDKFAFDNVANEWSTDPVMFEAITKFEQDRTEDINETLRERLFELVAQLEALQIAGFSANTTKKLLQALSHQQESRLEGKWE
jgi:hypothetical protein